jgi:nitroreductase
MDVRSLIAQRATRSFLPTPIPAETLTDLVECVRWTGSARNRQPWRFVAVHDAPVRAQLARLGAYAGFLADAPVVLVLLSPEDRQLDTEFDLGRIAQSITLAAAAAGLGSCVASLYPDDQARRAANLVRAEPGWSARHAIAVGHPAAPPTRSGRSAVPRGRHDTADLLRTLDQ